MSAKTRISRSILWTLVTAAALPLLLPLEAGAETGSVKPAATPQRAPRAAAVKAPRLAPPPVQKMIFTDEEVTADREGGAGDVVTVRQPIKHSSMIKIRAHFLPELLKSAEDV